MLINNLSNVNDSNISITTTERLKNILNTEQLDLNLSFYDHGGDSLTFLILISELSSEVGNSFNNIKLSGIQPLRELISSITTACSEKIEQNFSDDMELPQESENSDNTDGSYIPVTANRYSFLSKMGDRKNEWVVHSPVYKVLESVDLDSLKKAYACVSSEFDGLRLKANCSEGTYQQWLTTHEVKITNHIIDKEINKTEFDFFLRDKIDEVRKNISLENNMMLLLINNSVVSESYIVLIFHHILLDSVSLREVEKYLFDSLLGKSNFNNKNKNAMPASSYHNYCRAYYQRCEDLSQGAASYWHKFPWSQIEPTPCDAKEGLPDLSQKWTKERRIYFNGNEFDLATRKLAQHSHISMNYLILASLAKAYGKWSGNNYLLLDLAHHGRAIDLRMSDFAKTVGWINETVPLILPTSTNTISTIEKTKEQLLRMDKEASLYNYCRFVSPNCSISEQFSTYPNADISLNIELTFSEMKTFSSNISVYPIEPLPAIGQRVYPISGGAVRRQDYFYLSWDYNSKAFKDSSIESFLNVWGEEFIQTLFELSEIKLATCSIN